MWFNNRHTLGSYHHLNQSDSEGQTPSLIGRGPDIPVRVLLQLDRLQCCQLSDFVTRLSDFIFQKRD